MKIFNTIFAILFLGFAALQYNDPDPVVWILIYGAMAGVCFMAVRGRYHRPTIIALAAVYIIYALLLSPAILTWLSSDDRSLLFDELAKMQYPYIEETREAIGLVICLVVLLINWLHRK